MFLNDFGQKLKGLRTAKNISPERLAEEVKVTKSMIWSYELNKKVPTNIHLGRIRDYFEVTMDFFLDREKKVPLNKNLHTYEEIFNKYKISIDDIQISREELLESISYIRAKRIMKSQNLI